MSNLKISLSNVSLVFIRFFSLYTYFSEILYNFFLLLWILHLLESSISLSSSIKSSPFRIIHLEILTDTEYWKCLWLDFLLHERFWITHGYTLIVCIESHFRNIFTSFIYNNTQDFYYLTETESNASLRPFARYFCTTLIYSTGGGGILKKEFSRQGKALGI